MSRSGLRKPREAGRMERMKRNLWELIRYAVVGGIATLVDWFVLYACTEWVFSPLGKSAVYPAHVLSFLAGLTVNFVLSNRFVFTAASQRDKGKDFRSFLLFCVIGLIGLGLTELGAFAADRLFGSDTVALTVFGFAVKVYLIAKAIMTVIVLFWNYLARKFFIYDRKGGNA